LATAGKRRWLKLRQIEEVTPVDRQILNLGRGQNALHRQRTRRYGCCDIVADHSGAREKSSRIRAMFDL
jgi:hypothetical protein